MKPNIFVIKTKASFIGKSQHEHHSLEELLTQIPNNVCTRQFHTSCGY